MPHFARRAASSVIRATNTVLTSPVSQRIDAIRSVQDHRQNISDYQKGRISAGTFGARTVMAHVIPTSASSVFKKPIGTFIASESGAKIFNDSLANGSVPIEDRVATQLHTMKQTFNSYANGFSFSERRQSIEQFITAQMTAQMQNEASSTDLFEAPDIVLHL